MAKLHKKNYATSNDLAMHSNVAVRRNFFVKSLLHFGKFFINANFSLIAKYILKTTFNNDSVDILSVRKYYKLFTH